MAGPKIMWDAHNYLAVDLCVGRSWEDERPELTQEEADAAVAVVDAICRRGGKPAVTVGWDEDPLVFAQILIRAGEDLKELCNVVAESGVPLDHFHFRTDID